MQLLDERWRRLVGKLNPNQLVPIVQDTDKSCHEALFLNPTTGTIWRKRYWFKSSMGPAGEVWFEFIVPNKTFHFGRGLTKSDIARDVLFSVLCDEDESCLGENLSEANVEYVVALMVERMTDTIAQEWMDSHTNNDANRLGGDYGEDTYLDNEAEIDDDIATVLGFPTIEGEGPSITHN